MSRFDDELIKHADNAYQMRGLPESTTPKQTPYEATHGYQPYADAMVPAEVPINKEMAGWSVNQPMRRQLQVTDLDSASPQGGGVGEIVGQPGMSQVYALGGPDPLAVQAPAGAKPQLGLGASVNVIDESLYQVYKASREIRDAIDNQDDFDFGNLITASNEAATVMRFASTDNDINQVIGTVASIVFDIENDLASSGDYKQASVDLLSLEGLLEDINKIAAKENPFADKDEDEDDEDGDKKKAKGKKKKDCKHCKGKGCDKCKGKKASAYYATNGNQETGVTVDVRDLDDQAGVFDRQKEMTPDHTTNVLEGEEVNGDAAGYVPFYNDGSETGIVPQQGPHHQEVFPYDGTNPAFVPYQNALGAVQASREKIFESLQIVDRLEKLGMAKEEDRAMNIAKFEQMDGAKLAGFVASLDLYEESGARQPRSQKVASNGSNRLPEMGRLTTASTVNRQDLLADDWLMTL